MIELTNDQRKYFGLDIVKDSWDKVQFKGDKYRPESLLYFEGNTIKKQIVSTIDEYNEIGLSELTENRELLLPKTKRGKPKKLTPSILESRTPIGVYLSVNSKRGLTLGSHTSQTTFYSSIWEFRNMNSDIETMISDFISNSPATHLEEIEAFRLLNRKHFKYKSGDFFAFKINRQEYGFGRILLDVHKARKLHLLTKNHGLNLLMGQPVLIKLYAYKSDSNSIDIELLAAQKALPSDYIMDNILFYGEYEIIGHLPLEIDEFDFPMSYGMRIDSTSRVFLQWGLIHLELDIKLLAKYITATNEDFPKGNPNRQVHNPFGYYTIGFKPAFDTVDILETINNDGNFDFSQGYSYKHKWDLRNPKNKVIRNEIMTKFELDPKKNYEENCQSTGTISIVEWLNEMK